MSISRGVSVNKAQSDQFSAQKISNFSHLRPKLRQWIRVFLAFEDMSIFSIIEPTSQRSLIISRNLLIQMLRNVLPKWYCKRSIWFALEIVFQYSKVHIKITLETSVEISKKKLWLNSEHQKLPCWQFQRFWNLIFDSFSL